MRLKIENWRRAAFVFSFVKNLWTSPRKFSHRRSRGAFEVYWKSWFRPQSSGNSPIPLSRQKPKEPMQLRSWVTDRLMVLVHRSNENMLLSPLGSINALHSYVCLSGSLRLLNIEDMFRIWLLSEARMHKLRVRNFPLYHSDQKSRETLWNWEIHKSEDLWIQIEVRSIRKLATISTVENKSSVLDPPEMETI